METLKLVLKSEFRVKQLRFSTIIYDRVFFSMWRIPPIGIILYKLVLMVYVDYWLIETALNDGGGPSGESTSIAWAAWLTNWTYTLLAVHLTMSTLAIIVYHLIRFHYSRDWLVSRSAGKHWTFMQDDVSSREITTESYSTDTDGSVPQAAIVRPSSAPWYVIVLWILFDMSAVAVPLVTLMFFAFLWPGTSGPISMDNIQLHGINTVCMFIDLVLSPFPVRILHAIYPLTYGIIYIIFSVIYWAVDHKHVMYPGVLDWNDAGKTTGIVIGLVLLLLVFQLLLFAVHKLKMYIYFRLYSSDSYETIGE